MKMNKPATSVNNSEKETVSDWHLFHTWTKWETIATTRDSLTQKKTCVHCGKTKLRHHDAIFGSSGG